MAEVESFVLESAAFRHLARIPRRFSKEGENLSPPLSWSGAPSGTKQFALVCHDPDSARPYGFTHWVISGIPPLVSSLAEGTTPDAYTPGMNGLGESGYTGPYPRVGHGIHHYYFWVYALDQVVVKPNLTGAQLLDAVSSHVLDQARLVGTYERQKA